MPILSQLMYGLVSLATRNGLAPMNAIPDADAPAKKRALRTGIRGETYAYWYLRHKGYVFIARNYTAPGIKGEIDLVGYDGPVLAFVEVKTRAYNRESSVKPEDAVTADKRRNLSRMARHFLSVRRMAKTQWRFDILAIESRPKHKPIVRLHKGAFVA